MIILIPIPLFFSSTVYGVAGLSGKSKDYDMPFAQPDISHVFSFCRSLGDRGDDLDVLFRVHRRLIPALGIPSRPWSDCERTRQGTKFCPCLLLSHQTLFFLACRTFFPLEVGNSRHLQKPRRREMKLEMIDNCLFTWFGCF